MQTIHQKFIILPLALLIAFSPTFSYAEEREDKNERGGKKEQALKVKAEAKVKVAENDDDDNDKEGNKKNRKSCVKAFGHLISAGFMKKNDEVSVDFWKNCVLPFGIMKKLNGNATTTPDTIAPTISRVSILTGTSTLSVKWKTNEKATSTLYFIPVNPLTASASSTSSSKFSKDHLLSLIGLSASTTYYLRIESSDQNGNATSSATFPASTR